MDKGEKVQGSFTLVMRASLIYLGQMGYIIFSVKEVSERWKRKCHLWGMFSHTATWQSECKCLSEPPAATCSSFPASI